MSEAWQESPAATAAGATDRDGPSAVRSAKETTTSSGGMIVCLTPWLLFSFMTHREGAGAAGYAGLAAAALGVVLMWRSVRSGRRVKILDVAGAVLFALLSVAAFAGGPAAAIWVTDYGRAAATFTLAAVMLGSVAIMPFTEQYARESVPPEAWSSPTFRATNRRISLAWGAAVLVMAVGHTIAALVDPTSAPQPGMRPVDLVLNWLLPVALIAATVRYTNSAAARAGTAGPRAI